MAKTHTSANSAARPAHGMSDYPASRPHISSSYLKKRVDFVASQGFTLLSYHSLCQELGYEV